MKNITITLPEELARKAKVFAAENNTSVSKYVGGLLAEKLKAQDLYQASKRDWNSRKPAILNEAKGEYPNRNALYDR